MILPKSTQISRALAAKLTEILIANGYHTDLGARIFRGRSALYADYDIDRPYLNLITVSDGEKGGSRACRTHSRQYDLEIILDADPSYDEQQDKLLFDVRRVFSYPRAKVLDGLVVELVWEEVDLDDPVLGGENAAIRIPLIVTYAENYT